MAESAVWRWNVDDVWLTFSSAFQEMTLASEAQYDVVRYHHLSAALLFGGCAIESFMNQQMRVHLEGSSLGEDEILLCLRRAKLKDKMEKWPREIYGVTLSVEDIGRINKALELRHDVAHRKRRDHSLYLQLDRADIVAFIHSVQSFIADICAAARRPFPYWLLGWNYMGMNYDEAHPCLLNNQQFRYSLRAMGFDVPAADYAAVNVWEGRNMFGAEAFVRMRESIYAQAPDIEPRRQNHGPVPRLCKRWWDRAMIRN